MLRGALGRDCTVSEDVQLASPLGQRLPSFVLMPLDLCPECSDWPGAVGCVNIAPLVSQLLNAPCTPAVSLDARLSVTRLLDHILAPAPPWPVPFRREGKKFVDRVLRFGGWPWLP